MRVQQVLMPDGLESWTVLGCDGMPVPAVEGFLAHLHALDRAPTTQRTHATSLKLWLVFLDRLGVALDEASVEHVSRFVAWLRAPAETVTVLPGGTSRCSPATVNKHLAALFSFYDYQARNGVALAQSLVAWRRVNRGGYRSFLHHVTAGRPVATRPHGDPPSKTCPQRQTPYHTGKSESQIKRMGDRTRAAGSMMARSAGNPVERALHPPARVCTLPIACWRARTSPQ